jgi:hypothetical protein
MATQLNRFEHLAKVMYERGDVHGLVIWELLARTFGALVAVMMLHNVTGAEEQWNARMDAVRDVYVRITGINKRVHLAQHFRHAVPTYVTDAARLG